MNNHEHIVITGHTGVIGARLHQKLSHEDIELVLINSQGVFTQSPGQEPELVNRDIFDENSLLKLFDGARACIHLAAAQTGAVTDGVAPALLRNILLTDYFASLASKSGTHTFIYTSSGAVYYRFADRTLGRINEDTAILADQAMIDESLDYIYTIRETGNYGRAFAAVDKVIAPSSVISSISPRDGYAFGKYVGELCAAHHLPVEKHLSVRLANVYGPGDHDNRIIPRFIKTAKTEGSATVFDWSRNFIWVDDLLDIIERGIGMISSLPDVVNAFTPGSTLDLWDLANQINSMTNGNGTFTLNSQEYEPHYEWSTNYPEILPENPVNIQEGLSRLISR